MDLLNASLYITREYCHRVTLKPLSFPFAIIASTLVAWWVQTNMFVDAGSPQENYAPGRVQCPSEAIVRIADGLSISETSYMEQRRQKEIYIHLVDFFERTAIPGFDHKHFFRQNNESHHKPTIGIGMAISGGGFRAMLTGAGGLAAMDLRTEGANQPGHLGGLLQSMSYISGLSGGAWLVGSLFMNNMPKVSDVVSRKSAWNFEFNPLIGNSVDDQVKAIFGLNQHGELLELENSANFPTVKQATYFEDSYNSTAPVGERLRMRTVYNPYGTSTSTAPDDARLDAMSKFGLKTLRDPVEKVRRYYESLYEEIKPKKNAGFDVSITDIWGRALAKVFLCETLWAEMAWSDIVYTSEFQSFKMPYPILSSNALIPKTLPDANTSTIIEMTPFEFGSWSPTLGAFAQTRYIGTKLNNGNVVGSRSDCIQGFDNGAFILASSSSLFNDLVELGMKHLDGFPQIRSVLTKYKTLMGKIGVDNKSNVKKNMDYALFSPNPFMGFHKGVSLPSPAELGRGILSLDHLVNIKERGNAYTNSPTLHLVDGGEDDLNIPLDPLLRPQRKLDIVFAVDASIDSGPHPNGTALYRGTWRYHGKEHIHGVSYPHVPEPEELVALGIHKKPHFFGCNLDAYPNSVMFGGSDKSDLQAKTPLPKPPLIVYVPNHVISFNSQQSTTRLVYNQQDVVGMVTNGYNVITQSNSTEWAACVGCAMIHRETIRRGEDFPDFCKQCFATHCVN